MADIKVPVLTKEERLAALEQAKAARLRRAQVKEQVAAGELKVSQVLAMAEDEAVGKMRVADLIAAVPHYGEAKTAKLMSELKISESRRIRGLGNRQFAELIAKLG